jgi:hypothetical protein
MPAKLLTRHVPEWFSEQESILRLEIQRDVHRYLGSAAAESLLPRVADAPIERLVAVWHRIPYVDSFEELIEAQWSLGMERIAMPDLLCAAFGRPLQLGLFLELVRSAPDRKKLLAAVPWLGLLKNTDMLLTALRHEGWLLFRCPSETKAKQLQVQVRSSVVRCVVLVSAPA